jgi:hypothetical protein
MSFHNNWRKFLAEGKFVTTDDKLLREVSEEEMESITDVIGELGPEDKAFNHIFKGKNRVLIPFITKDYESDLGKFVKFFEDAKYKVDWDLGILSGEIEFRDNRSIDFLGRNERKPPKKKKIQMKVGKFLAKLIDDTKKLQDLERKILSQPELDRRQGDRAVFPRDITGNDINRGLDEKEAANYYRLESQINAYFGNNWNLVSTLKRDISRLEAMAEYWKTNAGYIKQNLNSLDDDKYAIVLTRDPIDIFRMSDFDDIASCHSPPSRDPDVSFFKCAVAEARGHGAVAYVVSKEDLLDAFGTNNIDEVEDLPGFQDDELFSDDKRYFGSGEIEPLSRVRLRQVRYYDDTDDARDASRGSGAGGTQLAVPESVVYGLKFPDLAASLTQWAQETQKEQIANIPTSKAGSKPVDLDKFVKFGGSYEDNNITGLLMSLLNKPYDRNYYVGDIRKNEQTEDDVVRNMVNPRLATFQEEVNTLLRDNPMNYFVIGETDVDEDGGDLFVNPTVSMKFHFPANELARYPKYDESGRIARAIAVEMQDMGIEWINPDAYRNNFRGAGEGGGNDGLNLILAVTIDGLSAIDSQYIHSAYMFGELLEALDNIDDRGDGFQTEIIEPILKREGLMEGGAILDLGQQIEGRIIETYEWDTETTGDVYDAMRGEEYLITSSYRMLTDFEGLDLEEVNRLIRTRDFWIRLRMAMHDPIFKQEDIPGDKRYYVPIEKYFYNDSPLSIDFKISYFVSEESPDAQVEIFKSLIEFWDDEDDMNAVVVDVLKKMSKQGIAFQPMKDTERNINIPNEREVQFESRAHRKVKKKMIRKPRSLLNSECLTTGVNF